MMFNSLDMTLQTQSLLAEIMATALGDPLINSRAEQTITISVWILIFAMSSVIGLFSRRLEHAVFFALASSIIGIAFFVIS